MSARKICTQEVSKALQDQLHKIMARLSRYRANRSSETFFRIVRVFRDTSVVRDRLDTLYVEKLDNNILLNNLRLPLDITLAVSLEEATSSHVRFRS